MKGNIKLLPDVVANQIAAGEVVVRPASVVKELMENAIDAQADRIDVVIRDSGRTLIQVSDNGTGMSELDARMALERHATSKISTSEDLQKLYSLGFRGEALPSIASVSQVTIKTKQAGEELGICLEVHGSKLVKQEYCQAQTGTTISVSQLFYNTPARRKFLKTDTVEFKHILDTFQQLALAHPEVYFTLYHNERMYHQLYAGNLKKRIVQIFGNFYEKRLIAVREDTDYLKINGYIGQPEYAKKSRNEQFFFINNRFIKNYRLNTAVFLAYDKLIQTQSYPFFCLFLQIDPEMIDVNVHPTKEEIKLEDENFVYNILHSAIKHTLMQYSVPMLDFDQNQDFVLKRKSDSITEKPSVNHPGGQSNNWRPSESDRTTRHTPADWDDFYSRIKQAGDEIQSRELSEEKDQIPFDEEGTKDEFSPIQIKNRYLLTSIKSGILLIDQKNAHERILYERFRNQGNNRIPNAQSLLFPEVLHLTPHEAIAMEEILPHMAEIGFIIEPFGKNDFILQAVPDLPFIEGQDKHEIIRQILEEYHQNRKMGTDLKDKIAEIFARNLSVKRSRRLSDSEIKALVNQLFACTEPAVSPSGKKCFITLNSADLEKQFS